MDMSFEFISEAVVKLKVATIITKLCNLRVKGKVRIVLAPLIDELPCVAGVSISFVEQPLIDFKFEAAKLNVMGVPGLSDMIIDVCKYQLASMIVWPKKMFFPLREMSEEELKRNSEVCAAGTVSLTVCEAKNLPKMDRFGQSDPFCVVHLGAKEVKTKVISKNLNPVWNQTWDFEVFDYDNDRFVFEVFDQDRVGLDNIMGSFEIPVRKIRAHHEQWYHIPPATGSVLIKASYTPFGSKLEQVQSEKSETGRSNSNANIDVPSVNLASPASNSQIQESSKVLEEKDDDDKGSSVSSSMTSSKVHNGYGTRRSSGDEDPSRQFYVFLKIIKADNLPTNVLGIHPETYVSVQLDDQYFVTKVSKRSSHPTWEEEFKLQTTDLENATLQFVVLNHNTITSDSKVATAQLSLHEIPFNVFVRENLELKVKSQKNKGELPLLKVKLRILPASSL